MEHVVVLLFLLSCARVAGQGTACSGEDFTVLNGGQPAFSVSRSNGSCSCSGPLVTPGSASFGAGVTVGGSLTAAGSVTANGGATLKSNVTVAAGAALSVDRNATFNVAGLMTAGTLTASTCNCGNFGSTAAAPIYSTKPSSRAEGTITSANRACSLYLNESLTLTVGGTLPVRYRFVFHDMMIAVAGGPSNVFTYIATISTQCSSLSGRVSGLNYGFTTGGWRSIHGEFYLTLPPGTHTFYYHAGADGDTGLPITVSFANAAADNLTFQYMYAVPA